MKKKKQKTISHRINFLQMYRQTNELNMGTLKLAMWTYGKGAKIVMLSLAAKRIHGTVCVCKHFMCILCFGCCHSGDTMMATMIPNTTTYPFRCFDWQRGRVFPSEQQHSMQNVFDGIVVWISRKLNALWASK